VLTPFPRLPSDPPELWTTVQAALDDPAKTRRLCLVLLAKSTPLLLFGVALILSAILLVRLPSRRAGFGLRRPGTSVLESRRPLPG
jgi:hypothetical protein